MSTDSPFDPKCDEDKMLYGLVGLYALSAAWGTEVNPIAAAAAFMSWLSAQAGRYFYIPIGDTDHHTRLFTLHVGRSKRGRKGDALGLLDKIEKRIQSPRSVTEFEERFGLLAQSHSGGLSTREGLVMFIHDVIKGTNKDGEEVIVKKGIDDKRIFFCETEFANVLQQAKRDGNTLSEALRDVFDGKSIQPAIKHNPTWATDPHIALHGCITPVELLSKMDKGLLTNGFLNRFFIIYSERSKLVPIPQPVPPQGIEFLSEQIVEVVKFAKGKYPDEKDTRRLDWADESVKERWRTIYSELEKAGPNELVNEVLGRQSAYTWRMAGLFALCDLCPSIQLPHLNAAYEWSKYHKASVQYIFKDYQDKELLSKANKDQQKVLKYLNGKDWVTKTDITRKAFGGHGTEDERNRILASLIVLGKIDYDPESRTFRIAIANQDCQDPP